MSGIVRPNSSLLEMENKEYLWIAILAFVFSFILTFRLWGEDSFDAAVGLTNWMTVFFGLLFTIGLHEIGHKIAGAREGYHVKIIPFAPGITISGFVALYSNGFIPIISPNLIECDAKSSILLGKLRKYENPSDMARIAIGGLVGSMIAILAFKSVWLFTGVDIFRVVVLGGVLHAIYSLIPWELINLVKLRYFEKAETYAPGDGMHILWWSRVGYFFMFIFMVLFGAVALMPFTFSIWIVAIIALFSAIALNKSLGL